MAALVKPEDQGQHVLTIVLPLAHDDDNEQFRISAVTLYNGLAEHFGAELCQQFCVPELISLSEDPVFRVRKSTALSFPNVCKTAGVELSRERLIPAFQRLAKDDIWGVRKACAECLVNVALALAPADRGPLLIPMFESFIGDSSRWVRMAAYQSLGPFLAALDKEQVTDELVGHFTSMATTAASQLGGSGEVDIKFHCAFNFPAVVSILGAEDWLKLSPTFELLHNDTFGRSGGHSRILCTNWRGFWAKALRRHSSPQRSTAISTMYRTCGWARCCTLPIFWRMCPRRFVKVIYQYWLSLIPSTTLPSGDSEKC